MSRNERARSTLAPSSTVVPFAMSASSPIVAPWTQHRWATVAPGPISVGMSGGPWSSELSWTFAPRRMMTGEKSAADHDAVPDGCAGLDSHIADERRRRSDERIGRDGGRLSFERVERHGRGT